MFVLCVCACVTSCRPTSGEHVGEVRVCASEARISIITGQQVLLCAIRARHSASLLQTVVLLQESCEFTRRRGVRRVVTLPIQNEDFIFPLSLQGSHPLPVYLRFPRSPHSIFLLSGRSFIYGWWTLWEVALCDINIQIQPCTSSKTIKKKKKECFF